MARVPYLTDEELVEPARHLVLGHPINLYRALANNAGAFECFAEMGAWIRWHSRLDARLREMAILTVGVVNSSEYEFSHHVKIGKDFGLVDEDIRAVLQLTRGEPSTASGLDRLVIEATIEITADGAISDTTWSALSKEFDASMLVELVLVTAHYSGVTRVLRSLQIDVEPDYQHFLEEFPLHA